MRGDAVRRRASVPLALELALMLVSAAAGGGLVRLSTPPAAWHVVGPVLVCVVAGHLAVSVVQRSAPILVAALAGAVAVVVACGWLFVPAATVAGFPTPAGVHQLGHLLRVAGVLIRSQATPIPATAGVRLWLAIGAGATAVAARALLGWRYAGHADSALVTALVAPTAAFAYTSLLSSEVDRVQGTTFFVAALVFYGFVSHRPWLAGRPTGLSRARGRARPVSVAALLTAIAVVAIPVVVSPAFASMTVDAVPFSSGGGAGGSGPAGLAGLPAVDAKDLVDNLRAVLVGRSGQVLFEARSPVATYWQLATLTRFNGTKWTPDAATAQAAQGDSVIGPFAPSLSEPQQAGVFDTSVVLDALRTSLLPVPPGALSLIGTSPVELIPSVGAYLTPPALPGFNYTVAATTAPTIISGGDADTPAPSLSPYLALPREPGAVVRLARSIVQRAPSPVAEAVDLVKFFGTGQFHYSLSVAPASDPLSSFLFDTHTGFCQQFAGAFAVLARVVGLPTRLAVGFTPGTEKDGRYYVIGADAHVWPQVYLGPALGWVSFEPTPAAGAPVGSPGVFTARSPVSSVGPRQPSVHSQVPAPTPGSSGPSGAVRPSPAASLGIEHKRVPGETATPSAGARPWVLVALGALMVTGLAVLTRHAWRRRWRRARARLALPRSAVLAQWRDACEELARRRLGRRQSETVDEHARRVQSQVSAAGAAYEQLARLAERASYSPEPVTTADVIAARRLRAAVCSELTRRRRPGPPTPVTGARR